MKALALAITVLVSGPALAQGTAEYKRLTSSCKSCNEIENLIRKHDTELSADARLKLALGIAKVIQGIQLKGKDTVEQKREIYFATNASLQVLPDDFDSETVVRLLDLRRQAPRVFDDVLWHFPLGQQQMLIERMRAFKEDKVRPNAQIPQAKELE